MMISTSRPRDHRPLSGVAGSGSQKADEHGDDEGRRPQIADEHRGPDDLATRRMIHDVLGLRRGESGAAERRSRLERRDVGRQSRRDQRTSGQAGEGHREDGHHQERCNCIHRPMFPRSRPFGCLRQERIVNSAPGRHRRPPRPSSSTSTSSSPDDASSSDGVDRRRPLSFQAGVASCRTHTLGDAVPGVVGVDDLEEPRPFQHRLDTMECTCQVEADAATLRALRRDG